MNKKVKRIVTLLLALVLLGSLGMMLMRTMDYNEGEETYNEAEDLVALPDISLLPPPVVETTPEDTQPDAAPETQPDEPVKEVYVDPYADALRNMDFTALQEVNSDVLGWILIPGTRVSYPLVQGEDNDYYLNHTWKKWRSAVGSIFLEHRSSSDFSDFHTIIYGHRMNNGSMFASLSKYKKQSYWEANPCVYITDAAGTKKYDIFAAYEVGTTEETYRILFDDEAAMQAYIDFCLSKSVIKTDIVPTVNDKIVTLSTCTGRGHATRWVVQARLQGEAFADAVIDDTTQSESAAPDEGAAEGGVEGADGAGAAPEGSE